MKETGARVSISEVPLLDSPNSTTAADLPQNQASGLSGGVLTDAWQVVTVKPRIDAFHHAELVSQIHEVLAEGSKKVALDLSQNVFFSLNAIQFCMSIARDLYADGGSLALVGCMERTKKHFDIYGSLKQIRVVRALDQLVTDGNTSAVNMRIKQIFPEVR